MSESGIRVYEKSTCTTCRSLFTLLQDRGIDFEKVEYHVDGLTASEIRDLLRMAGISAADALRMKEPGAAGLADSGEDEIIAAMVERPGLLQRPFVVFDGRAVLARPVERALEILPG